VLELSPDGAVLKSISLPDDMKSTWHAVTTLTGGGMLVCHGSLDDSLHRLCEVSIEGRLGRTYNGQTTNNPRASSTGEVVMKMPTHIAIDRHGYILLMDYFTSCVRLLSPQLAFKRYLLSGADQGLCGPTCMWLDIDRGMLCIGQFDGKVHLFRIMRDLLVDLNINTWK